MDLSLVTVEQMMDELHKRGLEFSLVLSQKNLADAHPEQAGYELYSSLPDSIHQSAHFLLAAISLLEIEADDLEEEQDPKGEVFRRWQSAGETLLKDILATAQDWTEEEGGEEQTT